MSKVRRRVLISGRVQGVAFRAYTRSVARQTGVCGSVRNLSDGRVEAVFEGDQEKVDSVIAWCRKGPPAGRVDQVQIFEEQPSGDFADFDITFSGSGHW